MPMINYRSASAMEAMVSSLLPDQGALTAPGTLFERAWADLVERAGETDETTTRVLDAALEEFCTAGIQRTTMEGIARRAGVSRITVYRRFANKDVMIEHVVRREFRRYFEQFLLEVAGADTVAERVVIAFVSSVRNIRSNRLIGGQLIAEPSSVLPSLIGDGGQTYAAVCQFVAGQLRREQQAGNVSTRLDADLVAEMMVRLTASFLLLPHLTLDLDGEQELREVAERFLVPMLQAAKP